MVRRMHDNEISLTVAMVRRMLSEQFPQWAHLPPERVESSGTVNAMFRLGVDKVVRLPFVEHGAHGIELEAMWLPVLAPYLPVRIPAVLGIGRPDAEYPCPWLVLDWLDGEHPAAGHPRASLTLASGLAQFISALRRIPTDTAPIGYRGGSFHPLDDEVRRCLVQARDLVDVPTLTAVWDDALGAAEWTGPPVWVHCDLLAANLLVTDDQLSGVLDFAAAGIGDPACDLMPAWSVLSAGARQSFRTDVGIDDATWRRGRGWALAQAAIALPYYRDSNRVMADGSLRALRELSSGNAPTRP